jgi:hypothetical protein
MISSDIMNGSVSEAEAANDRVWFGHNAHRRYRLRQSDGGWFVIRRRIGGVLLRTRAPSVPSYMPDTDKALRHLWVETAWSGLTPTERAELMKQIKRGEKLHGF